MQGIAMPALAMIRLLSWFFLLTCAGVAHAQDLIVKMNGDSINCKIRGMDQMGLHYRYLYGTQVENAYILRREVKEFRKGAFAEPYTGHLDRRLLRGYPYLRMSARMGPTWISGAIDSSLPDWQKDYLNEVRSGKHFAFDAHYMISQKWGLGLHGSWFRTFHTLDDVLLVFEDGTDTIGVMSDDVRISMIGPSACFELPLNSMSWHVYATLSLGMMKFRNDAKFIWPFVITGDSFGVQLGMNGEYRLADGIGFGIGLNRVLGAVERALIQGPPGSNISTVIGEGFSISRWDVSASVSYAF